MSEKKSAISDPILNGIIEGHRQIIYQRYEYEHLVSNFTLPDFVSKDQIEEIRSFFLNYVYPEGSKRAELNEAFSHLDHFIKSPAKFLAVIKESFSLMLRYGLQLPAIINAALKALKSFRSATRIENQLAVIAAESDKHPPYTEADILILIRQIPDRVLHDHMNSIWPLYEILCDRKLIKKILEVVNHLLDYMNKNKDVFSQPEIKGIQIGADMIAKAQVIFSSYTDQELKLLVRFVTMVEKDAYYSFLADPPYNR